MSATLTVAQQASQIDWSIVGSGAGVFLAAFLSAAYGHYKARKQASEKTYIKPEGGPELQIAGATIMDNASMRDLTRSICDLRDEVMMSNRLLENSADDTKENTRVMRDCVEELKAFRRTL